MSAAYQLELAVPDNCEIRLLTKKQKAASEHLYGMFPNLQTKVPECSKGEVTYRHSSHSAKQAYVQGLMRNELRTTDPMVCMEIGGIGWMFDTLHEKWMNRTAVVNARGDVLLGGLGMGLILWPILRKRGVRTVTVIENDQDVVDLILPTLAGAEGREKLTISMGDAREWEPEPAQAFDYIWLDCVPCYGYGHQFMEIHEGWLERYSAFSKRGDQAQRWRDVDHWGYQENLLWMLHGNAHSDQCDWPEADRRPYPIGPPDPALALMATEHGVDFDFTGTKKMGPDNAALVESMKI